jgi:hypothetical protein
MSNVIFTDPRTSSTYTWPRNPSSENAATKTRNIERTSNTGNVGATKQQGDDGPLILDFTINVLTTAMEVALWQWYNLSKLQTIYLTDWDGEEWEGQIIELSRQRLAQPVAGRIDYMVYDFQFEVYRLISGPLATAGVTP